MRRDNATLITAYSYGYSVWGIVYLRIGQFHNLLSDKRTAPHFLIIYNLPQRSRYGNLNFHNDEKTYFHMCSYCLSCCNGSGTDHGSSASQRKKHSDSNHLKHWEQHQKKPAPTAIVDADVKDDRSDHLLIRRGTPVEIAADIRKARGVGKGASIKFDFLSTTAVDGQRIRLQGSWGKEGDSKKGVALGVGLGVGLTVCWPCLFCLCIKGEKVSVPENTIINNVVACDSYRIQVE